MAAAIAGQAGEGAGVALGQALLQAAHGGGMGERGRPARLKRSPDGQHAAAFRGVKDGPGDGWEKMRVLVTVNVRDVDAGPLQGLNLGLGLAGEILRADGVAHRCLGEIQRLRTEGFVVGAEQRGDVPRVRDRDTVDEDEMAADPERGRVKRKIDGVAKGGPVAIRLAELSTPARCSSTMARLMPGARPKSSALRMRRGMEGSCGDLGLRPVQHIGPRSLQRFCHTGGTANGFTCPALLLR